MGYTIKLSYLPPEGIASLVPIMGSQEAFENDLPRVTSSHSLKFGVRGVGVLLPAATSSSSAASTPPAVLVPALAALIMFSEIVLYCQRPRKEVMSIVKGCCAMMIMTRWM
jgi:hypothetical protein